MDQFEAAGFEPGAAATLWDVLGKFNNAGFSVSADALLRAVNAFTDSLNQASKSFDRLNLACMDDPVQYIIDHPGFCGMTIYPDEAWRWRGKRVWFGEDGLDYEWRR